MRSSRSFRIAALTLMLAGSCCVLQSIATARSVTRSGAAGQFCSKPTIGVEEGASAVNARLGINKKTVRPGGTLRVRIEDFGTRGLAYSLTYGLARRNGGSWVKLPPRPIFAPRLYVPAGTASECQSIDIPRGAIAGRYRITKKVRLVGTSRTKELVVRATFRIRAARASLTEWRGWRQRRPSGQTP